MADRVDLPEQFKPAPPPKVGQDVNKTQCHSGIRAPYDGPYNHHEEDVPFYCDGKAGHAGPHTNGYGPAGTHGYTWDDERRNLTERLRP